MKVMTFLFKLTTVIVLSLFIFSCEGEDGPTGSEGPQGEQGEQGETGTANVIYSDWIDSEFPLDIMSTHDTFEVEATEITEEILNSGVVLVYGKSNVGANVFGLPLVRLNVSYNYNIVPNALNITVESLDGNNIGATSFSSYRYVIIPSGVAVTSKNTSTKDYTQMSYEDIKILFDITE